MAETIRKPWTEQELLLALNLYSKLPFGQIHSRNSKIIRLAQYMGRTVGSVAMKLCNFASVDPNLPRKGLSNASTLDREMWKRYYSDERLILLSEKLMTNIFGDELLINSKTEDIIEYKQLPLDIPVQTKTKHNFFRSLVLSNFDNKCCLTGISQPELIIACHISSWKNDTKNRLNPSNGICLNALHAKAFISGLITLDDDFKLLVSKKIPRNHEHAFILDQENQVIDMPKKYSIDKSLLAQHRENIFVA